jgi:ribosomal protein S18 acetylase RimI-like enzyme
MRHDDIAAGLRLCRAASWNQLASDWHLFLAEPGACRVAITETGEIVGSVATIDYGLFSWIAMVLVDPAYRRAGIGSQLLREALVILGDRTARLDATPAGCQVYAPLGFQEEYGLQRMTRESVAHMAAADLNATSAIRRMTDADFTAVLNHDRAVFGADRRRVLNRLRVEAPEYACVAGSNRIDGYVFGRHGHAFEHIGPIVARDESIARHLVSACVAGRSDWPFVLDAPLRSSWVNWLEGIGFHRQRPFTRMCRGPKHFEQRAEEIFAIAGPEFG